MKLPTNPTEVGKKHPGVSAERQKALVSHLEAIPDGSAPKVIDEIVKQGGPEGAFVAALAGRVVPGVGDAPKNKKLGL